MFIGEINWRNFNFEGWRLKKTVSNTDQGRFGAYMGNRVTQPTWVRAGGMDFAPARRTVCLVRAIVSIKGF